MTYDELRLECLRLAQVGANANSVYADGKTVVDRARVYFDFIEGRSGADNVGAARELLDKVR
jgi:hypothetical protein